MENMLFYMFIHIFISYVQILLFNLYFFSSYIIFVLWFLMANAIHKILNILFSINLTATCKLSFFLHIKDDNIFDIIGHHIWHMRHILHSYILYINVDIVFYQYSRCLWYLLHRFSTRNNIQVPKLHIHSVPTHNGMMVSLKGMNFC